MKIMLACCLGMSTSVVVQKMKDAAKEQGKDYEIWAVDQNKIAENVGNFDVLLLDDDARGHSQTASQHDLHNDSSFLVSRVYL